ncbi:cellulose biosynthesis protein BcsN [Devosia soli]|uniref:cellulose biosynthesis protein BcsN n=1 Tax=Devosia soli TaxID=361041 RepID=UPI00069B4F45|nr:cellulose biosynthesis protein BcsN [Devosia soli]
MQDILKFRLQLSRIARTGIAAGLLACALAGCATTTDMPTSEAEIVRASDAVILPPPGGPAIVTVVETVYPNAIRQDISLATEARSVGENKISVIRFIGKGGDGSDAALKDIPFTQVNLTEEALAAWPGSGMAVSPYFVQNAYGPFGYAIAKPANGDTCLYAWQRIEPTLKPSGAVDRGTIIIRVQACRRGVSEEALLELMYRLRLNVNVFPPSKAPAVIGAIANPIRPVGADGFAEVIPSSQPVVARRPAPRATPVVQAVAAPAIPVPPAGAPIVPPPTGTSGQSTGPTVPRPTTSSVTVPSPPTGGN